MTLTDATATATVTARTWRPRSELDLADQQLRAIARFNQARRTAEDAAVVAARSREMRMDAARSLEVLRREHEAVVHHAHQQLRVSGQPRSTERRVVLAHRNEWFVGKLAQSLQDRGFLVVARLDNGADAVGLAIAEQPDLVLVEDTLAMVPGEQVVREVRRYCPQTRIVAQVAYGDRVPVLLDAGATSVFTRQAPPRDVVQGMVSLMVA